MGKLMTSKKSVLSGFDNVIAIGYCKAQYLLKCESPVAYTAGREGWRADVYSFGSVAIVTGYAPFGREVSYDLIREYDERAEKLCSEVFDFKDRRRALRELIDEFLGKVFENNDEVSKIETNA